MLLLPKQDNMRLLGDTELDLLTKLVYHPIAGIIYQRRYEMVLSLLPLTSGRILEIGYGTGLLLPSLGLRCERLYGVDIHHHADSVREMLEKENCQADLKVGSVIRLPFEDDVFDSIICLSVLEHLVPSTLSSAMKEMQRALRTGGVLVLGFPVKNIFTRLLFSLVGFDDRIGHPSSHQVIIKQLRANFSISQLLVFPSFLPQDLAMYAAVKCYM